MDGNIRIGCKVKSIPEWDECFKGNEEFDTERNTPEFARIQAMYEAYKAYYLLTKDLNK